MRTCPTITIPYVSGERYCIFLSVYGSITEDSFSGKMSLNFCLKFHVNLFAFQPRFSRDGRVI